MCRCYRFVDFLLIICVIALFSGCQKVSESAEGIPEPVFIDSPLTENPAASESENSAETTEISANKETET